MTKTVADGSSTNDYIPFAGRYADGIQHQQVIYPSEMLTDIMGSTISSMTFYLNNLPATSWNCPFSVRLASVDVPSFQNSVFLPVNNTVEVYSGIISIDAVSRQLTIDFTIPFNYTGGNLLLDVRNTTGGNQSNANFFGISRAYSALNSFFFFGSEFGPNAQGFIPKTTFTYTGGASCLTPTDFNVEEVDATSVTLSWHAQSENAQYQVCCVTAGTDITNVEWTLVSDTTITFNNLIPNIIYTAYVRSYCGGEVSGSTSISFHTECGGAIADFPWTEGFEESWDLCHAFGQENSAPQCWEIYNGGTTEHTYGDGSFYWKINRNAEQVHSGQHSAVCYTEYAIGAHNDWLISPQLNLSGEQRVVFYAQNNVSNTTKIDEISVWISDENIDLQDPASDTAALPGFTQLFQTEIPVGEFHKFKVSLAGYSGNRRIAFVRRNSPNSGWYLCLDDVTVENIPPCETPTELSAVTTAYEAQLSWSSEAETCNLYYKPEAESEYILVPAVSLNEDGLYVLSELNPATTYQWYVEAVCQDQVSPSTVATFNTSCAAIAHVPQVWDFDHNVFGGTSSYPLPACWERLGSQTYPYVYNNEYEAYSGEACLLANSGNSVNGIMAVLPIIDTNTLSINTLQLRFLAKISVETEASMEVGLMSNLLDTSTFELVHAIQSLTDDYMEYKVTFAHVVSSAAYVVIRMKTNGQHFYIDDMVLEEIPECDRPVNLQVLNVTSNSAAVQWSSSATETNVYYQEIGNGVYVLADGCPVYGTSYTLHNLTPNTNYNIYVSSICQDGSEIASSAVSFMTECVAIDTIPYVWDFESNNTSGMPVYPMQDCWHILNTTAPSLYVANAVGLAHTGTHCLYSVYPDESMVILPAVNNQTLLWRNLQLSFYARDVYGRGALLEVGLMSNIADASSFENVLSFELTNNYQLYEVPLIHYNGTGTNLAFRITANYDYVVIDDVVLDAAPNCLKPTNVACVSTGSDYVELIWDPGNNEVSWDVVFGVQGFDPDTATNILHTQTSLLNIGNLSNDTTYDFYVRAICGENEYSEWQGFYAFRPGSYNMRVVGTDTLYTCGATIYDNGGATGEYSENCDSYLVIYPSEEHSFVEISGGTLVAESYMWDFLVIYDGVGTSNELYRSRQEGESAVSIPTVTSHTGPLTIYFHSDASVSMDGFVLYTTCVSCVQPDLYVSAIGIDSVTIAWSYSEQENSSFELVYGPVGINPDISQAILLTNVYSYTISNLPPDTTLDVYVRVRCEEQSYGPWAHVTVSTLPYAPATLPYSCDFENGVENAKWTIDNGNQINKWYINSAVNNTANGDSSLYISKDNGLTNSYFTDSTSARVWAYRDIKFSEGDEFLLTFDWRSYGEGTDAILYDYLSVYIGDPFMVHAGDENVPEEMSLLGTFCKNPTWSTANYVLGNEYANKTKRLFFFWRNDDNMGTNPPAAVDNIVLRKLTCIPSINMAVSDITATTATVTIAASDEIAAWQLKLGSTVVTVTDTNSFVLTGLTPATLYEVCVRSICVNGDSSIWSPTTSFVTECQVISLSDLPYVRDFEQDNWGGTPNYPLPVCWNRTGGSTDYPFVSSYGDYAYSGEHYLYSGEDPTNYIVVLPKLNTAELSANAMEVDFFAKVNGYNDYTYLLELGVMSDMNEPSSFVPVDTINTLTGDYQGFEIFLNTYVGQGAYIAFRINARGSYVYNNYYAYASIYIDDVVVKLMPNCHRPTNLVKANVTSSSVAVTWTPGANENQWDVAVGTPGFNPDVEGAIYQSDTNYYSFDNLTVLNMYDVYVRANCGDNEHSEWRGPIMVIPGAYIMNKTGSDTISACDILIYDDGGPLDNYSGNCDAYLVVYPDMPNSFVEISGTITAEYYVYDYLVIYDGVGTERELFHSSQDGNQQTIPPVISSTGPLTIYFHSDYDVCYNGFELSVSCVSCVAPAVSLTSVYTDSAVVSWTCTSPSVYNYELVYGPSGFVPDAGTPIVLDSNTTSYALMNLIMDFSYDVYIRTNCTDGGTSSWSHVLTFETYPSMPATVPYSCNFEDEGENSSWTIENGGQVNKWYVNQLEGSAALYIAGDGGLTNTYVHSQASSSVWAYRDIIFSSHSNFVLSFDWRCNGEAMEGMSYDYLKVFIGDPVQVSSGSYETPEGAVELGIFNMQDFWTRVYYPLGSEYSGTVKRLYFLWRNDFSEGWDPAAAVDNIAIDVVTCVNPVEVSVSNITPNSAEITISPEGDIVAWQLMYGNNQITVTEDTTFVLTNLTPATLYEISARSICAAGDTSVWIPSISFLTECGALGTSSLPYTCDFENNNFGGSELYPLPVCWQRTGDIDRPYVERVSVFAHSGTRYLTTGDDATDYYVILPQINTAELSASELQLGFYAMISDFSGSIDVGVMTDSTDVMTFTPVSTINALTQSYTEFEVPLSHYTGNGSYIAMRMNSVGGTDYYGNHLYATIYIDDVTLDYIPDCQQPADLSQDNLTSSSADLSWSDVTDSYVLYYRIEGTSEYTQVNNVTLTNGIFTLSGLSAATSYEWYVASVCSSGSLVPSHTIGHFTTMCETIADFPYQESFENGLACWSSSAILGDWQWQTENDYGDYNNPIGPADGNSFAEAFYYSSGLILRLSSPIFDLTSVQEPYIKFYHIQQIWVSDQDYLKIYYKTSAEATPVLLVSYESNIYPWRLDSLALPNPSEHYQLLFDAHLNYGYGVGVDKVIVYDNHTVEPVVEWPVVVTEEASDITQTTATLNGTITNFGNQTITSRGFEWKLTNTGSYEQVLDAGTTSAMTYSLINLTANTSYTYRAFVSTADTTVYGVEVQFNTLNTTGSCVTPTNLQVTNISATSAEVSWAAGGDEESWVVEYKLQTESGWQVQSVNEPQVTLADLTPGSAYQVRVKAVCADMESEYANTSFTTSVGINEVNNLANSITLMPNPADHHINIHIQSNVQVDKIEIYNAMGQWIQTVQLQNQQAHVNLENMSAGMYFVRVYSDRSVVTKKFIKR